MIIREINFESYGTNDGYEIERVEFFIDDTLKFTDYEYPYEYLWDAKTIGKRTIKTVAYYVDKEKMKDEIWVLIFNLGI